MLQTNNEEAGESLSIRLIPNHDHSGENLRFATIDVAQARVTIEPSAKGIKASFWK